MAPRIDTTYTGRNERTALPEKVGEKRRESNPALEKQTEKVKDKGEQVYSQKVPDIYGPLPSPASNFVTNDKQEGVGEQRATLIGDLPTQRGERQGVIDERDLPSFSISTTNHEGRERSTSGGRSGPLNARSGEQNPFGLMAKEYREPPPRQRPQVNPSLSNPKTALHDYTSG